MYEMGFVLPLHPLPVVPLSANTVQVPQANVTHPVWVVIEPPWPEPPASEDKVLLGCHTAAGAASAALGEWTSPARLAGCCGV